jgi:hypothetical protein
MITALELYALSLPIPVIQYDITKHHNAVQGVKSGNRVKIVQNFMNDDGRVSGQNKP